MLQIIISSAVALSNEQKQKLEAGVQKKYAKDEVSFVYQLQPSLIAGISVSVAGKLYDASLRARLNQLALKL